MIAEDAVRDAALTIDEHGPMASVRRLTLSGLYRRWMMTALIQRRMVGVSPGSVDRAMTSTAPDGVRRSDPIPTAFPAKNGPRAGDLLDRDSSASAPNRTWVMEFAYMGTWARFMYMSFSVDVFADQILAERRHQPGR